MKKYKVNKGFIVQKTGGKISIFDTEKSVMYTFNETAAFIFSQVKKNTPRDLMAKRLADKFIVAIPQAEKDIDDFIDDLIAKKIVVVVA